MLVVRLFFMFLFVFHINSGSVIENGGDLTDQNRTHVASELRSKTYEAEHYGINSFCVSLCDRMSKLFSCLFIYVPESYSSWTDSQKELFIKLQCLENH
jgi:hypothetical protein